jgi:hypothetical protein
LIPPDLFGHHLGTLAALRRGQLEGTVHLASYTFSYGGIEPETQVCRDRDSHLLGSRWTVGSSDLAAARGRCFTHALQLGADCCLMIDRDMVWPDGAVESVTQAAVEAGGVASPLCPVRKRGGGWCASLPPGKLPLGSGEVVDLPKPYAFGAGFLAISRKAMLILAEAEPEVEGGYHPVFGTIFQLYFFTKSLSSPP